MLTGLVDLGCKALAQDAGQVLWMDRPLLSIVHHAAIVPFHGIGRCGTKNPAGLAGSAGMPGRG